MRDVSGSLHKPRRSALFFQGGLELERDVRGRPPQSRGPGRDGSGAEGHGRNRPEQNDIALGLHLCAATWTSPSGPHSHVVLIRDLFTGYLAHTQTRWLTCSWPFDPDFRFWLSGFRVSRFRARASSAWSTSSKTRPQRAARYGVNVHVLRRLVGGGHLCPRPLLSCILPYSLLFCCNLYSSCGG